MLNIIGPLDDISQPFRNLTNPEDIYVNKSLGEGYENEDARRPIHLSACGLFLKLEGPTRRFDRRLLARGSLAQVCKLK